MRRYFRLAFAAAMLFGYSSVASAQERIRIGVLNDQSGVFSEYQGTDRSSRRKWPSRTMAARLPAGRLKSFPPIIRTRRT
jgi:hypothetical protein